MKKIIILLTTISFILFSCKKNIQAEIQEIKFKFPVIIDTLQSEVALKQTEKSSVWQETSKYNPIYIGKMKDSIYVSFISSFWEYDKLEENENCRLPQSSDILLLIDTARFISSYYHMKWDEKSNDVELYSYKAYPVIIANMTKDSLYIGSGRYLSIIMEARNEQGQWQAIEEKFTYGCGTGLRAIILPSENIAVTTVPIYSGNYKTKLRLRIRDVVSPEFNGTINLTQFKEEEYME